MGGGSVILLHIGLPKTGTTAFQEVCLRETAALARQGVGFHHSVLTDPREGALELSLSAMRPGVECMAATRRPGLVLEGMHGRAQAAISATLAGRDGDRVIFSDENLFFLRQPDELARLRALFPAGVRFEVFLTLRDPADWGRSYAAQILAVSGRRLSADPTSAFHVAPGSWIYDFEEIARVWRAAFGSVTVLHYDPRRAVPDLFDAMGVSLPAEAMAVRARTTGWRMRMRAWFPVLAHLRPAVSGARKALGRVKRALF